MTWLRIALMARVRERVTTWHDGGVRDEQKLIKHARHVWREGRHLIFGRTAVLFLTEHASATLLSGTPCACVRLGDRVLPAATTTAERGVSRRSCETRSRKARGPSFEATASEGTRAPVAKTTNAFSKRRCPLISPIVAVKCRAVILHPQNSKRSIQLMRIGQTIQNAMR